MGSTFCNNWRSANDVKSSILADNGSRVLGHSSYGNEFYVAIKNYYGDGKNGIVLFLIKSSGGEYGYKAIGEESGPYYYECSEKVLKLSETENAEALKWHEDCRSYKANKKAAKAKVLNAKFGDLIETDFGPVIFNHLLKASSGAFAAKNKDGKLFRYYPKNVVII